MCLWDCYVPRAVNLHLMIRVRLYTLYGYRIVNPTGSVHFRKVVIVGPYSLGGN